jgi:hypothetical protein
LDICVKWFDCYISDSVSLEDMDQDEKDRDEYEVLREQVSNNTIPSTTRMGPA